MSAEISLTVYGEPLDGGATELLGPLFERCVSSDIKHYLGSHALSGLRQLAVDTRLGQDHSVPYLRVTSWMSLPDNSRLQVTDSPWWFNPIDNITQPTLVVPSMLLTGTDSRYVALNHHELIPIFSLFSVAHLVAHYLENQEQVFKPFNLN